MVAFMDRHRALIHKYRVFIGGLVLWISLNGPEALKLTGTGDIFKYVLSLSPQQGGIS